ncbi:MAG: AAA family ATPase [Thermoplasmata archaeon]
MMAAGRSLPLAERLRPFHLEDLLGNPRARAELRSWADGWSRTAAPSRRAAILSGPPGVGKTSAALALAHDRGWAVVEMNASEARNADSIDRIAGRASRLRSFGEDGSMTDGSRTLILLDEADCLSGRASADARPTPKPKGWREFLHDRYGSPDEVNRAWGLGKAGAPPEFASWDEIPKFPARHRWTTLAPAQRDLADWRSASVKVDLTDRGGLGAIAKLVKETRQPLVLTVNDDYLLSRYSAVFRSAVLKIRFYPLSDTEIRMAVLHVARREGFSVDARAIDAIVARAHGDLRAALNDLDAVWPLAPGPDQVTVLGPRDRIADLERLTGEALTAARYYRSVEIQERADSTPEELEPWIEENLPRAAVDADHRWMAFVRLAQADLLLARARRSRIYGLWSSASELMTGGVGIALREAPGRPVEVAFPQFLGEMGRTKAARALREALLSKLGAPGHISRRKLREGEFGFFETVFRRATSARREDAPWRNLARSIVQEIELTTEEVGYLGALDADSDRVSRLYEAPEPVAHAPREPPSPAPARGPGQRSLAEFE